MLKKISLVAFLIASADSPSVAAPNLIELPDSLWVGDSVVWERKVPAYCEGPAYEYFTGYVYFTQQIGNSTPNWPVWRVNPGVDTGGVWYNTYQNNGLEFDRFGRLIVAQNGRLSRLTAGEPFILAKGAGSGGPPDTATIVASGINGVTFGQANDLTIGYNGDIFFTALGNAIYYMNPGHILITATNAGATITSANGIERLPGDTNSLYVNSTSSGFVYKYTIGANGSLSNKTTFISGITQPDGGTYDAHGNRYIASYGQGEIRVFSAKGDSIGRIALRVQSGIYDSVTSSNRVGIAGNVDNCVFGGNDMKTLYMTGDGGLFSIRLKVPGVSKFSPANAIRPSGSQSKAAPLNTETESREVRGRLLTPSATTPAVQVPLRKTGH